MSSDLQKVQEKQDKRFKFLKYMYDTDTKNTVGMSVDGIATFLKIPSDEALEIADYLHAQGLAKFPILGPIVKITHAGRVEVESAIMRPEKPTDHFPAYIINIHNTGIMTSPIQQGTIGSHQVINITEPQREVVISAIAELKAIIQENNSLNDEIKDELAHEISMAESEAKAKKPKWERVKNYLSTAKNIAESTAIAISAIPKIEAILHTMGF